jgi:hypothetical protein
MVRFSVTKNRVPFCPKNGLSNVNFYVGFVGINNSEGYGNMSTFWANPPQLTLIPLLPSLNNTQ